VGREQLSALLAGGSCQTASQIVYQTTCISHAWCLVQLMQPAVEHACHFVCIVRCVSRHRPLGMLSRTLLLAAVGQWHARQPLLYVVSSNCIRLTTQPWLGGGVSAALVLASRQLCGTTLGVPLQARHASSVLPDGQKSFVCSLLQLSSICRAQHDAVFRACPCVIVAVVCGSAAVHAP
jgi:hypothetical protein